MQTMTTNDGPKPTPSILEHNIAMREKEIAIALCAGRPIAGHEARLAALKAQLAASK